MNYLGGGINKFTTSCVYDANKNIKEILITVGHDR